MSKKKCPNCKKYNYDSDSIKINISYFCDIECATKYAYRNKDKGAKIKHSAQKKELKSNDKAFRTKQAQIAFNAFIRNRDELLGCISCDKDNTWHGQWHAGHYKTTKSRPDIRFNKDNCHKQCKDCNGTKKSGNAVRYRQRLLDKIGPYRLELLEGPHELPKWKWHHYKAVHD